MATKKVKTSKSVIWNANLRFKVGETCLHNEIEWSNLSGSNSEPAENSGDWLAISTKDTTIEDTNTSAFLEEDLVVPQIKEKGKAVRYGDLELLQLNKEVSSIQYQATKEFAKDKEQWMNVGIIEQSDNKDLVQAYLELFGDSPADWNGNPIPNAIIGKCNDPKKTPTDNTPVMSFCAIEDETNYTKVTNIKRVLFKWVNGYIDSVTLMELSTLILKLVVDLQLQGQIIDNNGSTGIDGDVLKKVGGKVVWEKP